MNKQTAALAVVLPVLCGACVDNLQVPQTNVTPVAVARLLGDDSQAPRVVLESAPLELTLDGTGSSDPDGDIRTYRWLSGTPAGALATAAEADEDESASDAGADAMQHGRWVPDGASVGWPDDVAQPVVRLPSTGRYGFTLWVIDDRGRISVPSSLLIEVVQP